MGCNVTFSVVNEHQEGNVGNDWKYVITAKVYDGNLKGEGKISVEEHILESGESRTPPGPPEPVVIPAGDGGSEVLIRIHLHATEVDVMVSDHGYSDLDVRMDTPTAGGQPSVKEVEISAGVQEMPAVKNETAVFTARLRFEAQTT